MPSCPNDVPKCVLTVMDNTLKRNWGKEVRRKQKKRIRFLCLFTQHLMTLTLACCPMTHRDKWEVKRTIYILDPPLTGLSPQL